MDQPRNPQDPLTADEAQRVGFRLRTPRRVHLTIRMLREAAGFTQAEVAGASKIDQADISRLEGKDAFSDCQVSTLERYFAALGGQLELVAAFGDKRIILAGASAGSAAQVPAPDSPPRARRAARRGGS